MSSILDDKQAVFYQPAKPGIIDVAILRDGVLRGGYSNETLEEIQARYPGATVGELGPVSQASEDSFRSVPVEVDEERFREMLEVLPPVGWHQQSSSESFKLSERTYGNITAILCRIKGRYFEMQNDITMKHEDILRCVLVTFPESA